MFCGHTCSPTSKQHCIPVFSEFWFSYYIIFGVCYVHPSPHVRLFHVIMVEVTINIHTLVCAGNHSHTSVISGMQHPILKLI